MTKLCDLFNFYEARVFKLKLNRLSFVTCLFYVALSYTVCTLIRQLHLAVTLCTGSDLKRMLCRS
jgi:hypothetical protein